MPAAEGWAAGGCDARWRRRLTEADEEGAHGRSFDVLTRTINGGTGRFAAATGTILATGIGYNFFPLPPGPSSANNSSFDFKLSGDVCGVAP
jgi:hypothetical protein